MKKIVSMFCFLMLSVTALLAQPGPRGMINIDVIIGNRPPAPNEAQLMRAEEANHPNIAGAMHDIEKAMRSLHNAPDEFGGKKAQAETDLKQAWISPRKALYFRLYQDTH